MNDNVLTHYGVLGMRWGRSRRQQSIDSGKTFRSKRQKNIDSGKTFRSAHQKNIDSRKTSIAKGADGRKVNKLLGKRNREKVKKLLYNKNWKKDMANDPLIKSGKNFIKSRIKKFEAKQFKEATADIQRLKSQGKIKEAKGLQEELDYLYG